MKTNLIITTCILSLIFPLTALMYYFDGSLLKIPLCIYSGIYFSMSVGSVIGFTSALYLRLNSISHVLMSISKNQSDKKIIFLKESNNNPDDDSKIIATLAEIYQDLIESYKEVNICSGFSLMLGFGLIFFCSLFSSFSIFTDFLDGTLSSNSCSSVGFVFYYNIVLMTIILTCRQLIVEV